MQVLNGGSLHEQKVFPPREVGCELTRDHAHLWMLLTEIQLVADKHYHDIGLSVLFNLFNPLAHAHERLLLGYVVYNQGADRLAVVA